MAQWSRYNVPVGISNSEMLLFNIRTGALVRLSQERKNEMEHPDLMEESFSSFLFKQGFLIPNDFDEVSAVTNDYEYVRQLKVSFSATLELTEECNFRCSYCYQSHYPKHLDAVSEKRVLAFLIRKMRGVKRFHVNWFGGEPLLRVETLTRMSRSLAEQAEVEGCNFTQHITTNGYLLTSEMAQQLAKLGVGNVQITLDGDKEAHDQLRQLVSKRGTYEKVLQGCENAVSVGIELIVRVNLSRINVNHIEGLIKDLNLHGITGKNAIIHIVRAINHGNCDDKTADILYSNAEFSQKWIEILQIVSDAGFSLPTLEPRGYNCTFDLDQTVMIYRDGHIGHCSSSNGYLADLDDHGNEINIGPLYAKIKNRNPGHDPKCRACQYLPMCMGGCSYLQQIEQEKCNPEKYVLKELIQLTAKQITARDKVHC